jgi:NAD(P)H-hydrate epimerase
MSASNAPNLWSAERAGEHARAGGDRPAGWPVTRRFPAVTAAEMREVDRIMVAEYGIDLVRMMENAGRSLAELAIARFRPETVTVLAGTGGNGGGGLVAARHLTNRGVPVTVALARADMTGIPGQQLHILRRMGVPAGPEPTDAGLVIDAVIGYSLHGDPTGPAANLITWANAQPAPVLALDVPSGLDATHGLPYTPCAHATATLTLALPKTGLLRAAQVGELYLADIGVPPAVYRRFGLDVPPLFTEATLVRVPTHR